MGKPRMIILIRHAQSEGNKNRDIHQTVPDHRVKLTAEGWRQAEEAGVRLRSMLRPDDKIHFFTSPYRRTRETTEGILKSLTSDSPAPSPFPRRTIKVYEEPRLREQDFGNFQPCSAEMERMWHERADYGHFFYRIPNGESAADAYDRVSGFNESLWRQFGEDDFANICVLVTHGLMTRVFLMKWRVSISYHFSVEYFEDLRNINHCEFIIMKKDNDSGKYILQNNLRTWSELKRERAIAEGRSLAGMEKPQEIPTIPTRKKWGGCPHGCDHGKFKGMFRRRRENTTDMSVLKDATNSSAAVSERAEGNHRHPPAADTVDAQKVADLKAPEADEEPDDPRGCVGPPRLELKDKDDLSDIVSSPDGTPPFISFEASLHQRLTSPHLSPHHISVLQAGRDFGGSRSGVASRDGSYSSGSDHEGDTEEHTNGVTHNHHHGHHNHGHGRSHLHESTTGMGMGARADALGDHLDAEADADADRAGDADEEDGSLSDAERKDKSLRGSVY